MSKIAFLFPGQGSQAVGMGKEAAEVHLDAMALFDRANDILDFDLKKLAFDGPEETLRQTQYTQPALYVSSAATLVHLRAAGLTPFAVAGHSLGEYTALYAAAVYDFETGLRLVQTRGNAFADASSKKPGAMAAILGLTADQVEQLCRSVSTDDDFVLPANYNEPTQMVISGMPAAVDKVIEKAEAAGARRVVKLPVSGAFHSPVVEEAAQIMRAALEDSILHAPACHFVNNVDAAELTDPQEIRDSLVRQATGPVRWTASIAKLRELGVESYIEVGSGKVLTGLMRRIDKSLSCSSTESLAAIEKSVAATKV